MLNDFLFRFIDELLTSRPIYHPRHVAIDFPDGYQPVHLKCYRTAKAVQRLRRWPVIAGIAFLDKVGKLYPWPHMVNAIGTRLSHGLVDASPGTTEPNLGFVAIRLDETNAWNAITSAYQQMAQLGGFGLSWQDINADTLTTRHLDRLRARSFHPAQGAASPESDLVSAVAIPDLPEIT